MINHLALRLFRLTTLAIALSSSAAYAGEIKLETAQGDLVVAMLNSDAQVLADAFRSAITATTVRPPEAGNPTMRATAAYTGNQKRQLLKATKQATVSRMEYVYTINGVKYSRTYYSRSGTAMGVTFRRMQKLPNSGSESTDGSTGSYVISDDDIAIDLGESEFYPADTPFRVRAPNLPKVEGGVVDVLETEVNHAGDAELKIFRKIEADIAAKVIPTGGRLAGYVSKALCISCQAAAVKLATTYDINGSIYQLLEAGVEPASDVVKRESVRLSGVLSRRRNAYVTENLIKGVVPLDRTARIIPDPVELIEAEEARRTIALPCGA
jgi:hypothetical protein